MATMRLKVQLDADKVKALDDALADFRERSEETEKAILKVKQAMYEIQDALTVTRGD